MNIERYAEPADEVDQAGITDFRDVAPLQLARCDPQSLCRIA